MKKQSLWILTLLIQICVQNSEAHPACETIFDDTDYNGVLQQIVNDNDTSSEGGYKTQRDLLEYIKYLGPRFANDLTKLGPEDHIIDSGAGLAVAMKDILTPYLPQSKLDQIHQEYERLAMGEQALKTVIARDQFLVLIRNRDISQKPRITAITYKVPARDKNKFPKHLRMVIGRFLEKIPNLEITKYFGKASMIIDQFGTFAYTPNPSLVLKKYVQLLRPNGVVYMQGGRKQKAHDRQSSLFDHTVSVGTQQMSLVQWVRDIQGLNVQMINTGEDFYVLRITRGDGPINIPQLRLVGVDDNGFGTIPTRSFVQD